VLMSIFRTLNLRGHVPTRTIAAPLRELLQTGNLPTLPAKRRCKQVKCYDMCPGRGSTVAISQPLPPDRRLGLKQ
jgi:hypothetical protein